MSRARDVADIQYNLGGAVPPFVAGKNKIINGGTIGLEDRKKHYAHALHVLGA